MLFGASTGRDGIGGASVLASAELGGADRAIPQGGREKSDKRPTVQVGDPFEEKKLLECSLELLERGLLVALQDLGAAGLTSSASEMASKGEVGIDIDVARVPLREPGMEPFEIMVSESQERMLCVVEPADVPAVLALCEKWEIGGAAIGTVTDTRRMRIFDGERLVGEMPVRALVDECPLYDLHPASPTAPIYATPAAHARVRARRRARALLALLRSPNIASRRPLFEQYDAIVQSRTVRRPGQADAAVLALLRPGSGEGKGSASEEAAPDGSRPRYRRSRSASTATAAASPPTPTAARSRRRSSAPPTSPASGAAPLGMTNNLNFGNPEKPHIAWQLSESVRGLGDACRALAAPIVGGNVSLYNEGAAGPIYPTPVVGMVGHLPDAAPRGAARLRARGRRDRAGGAVHALAGRERARQAARASRCPTGCPRSTWRASLAAQAAVREAVRAGRSASAHDIAEGGLAVALAECCLAGGRGRRGLADAPRSRAEHDDGPVRHADAALRRGAGRLRRQRSRRRTAELAGRTPPGVGHVGVQRVDDLDERGR